MKRILIIGSSSHAKVVVSTAELTSEYSVFGLIDPYKVIGSTSFGYEILGSNDDIPSIIKENNIYGVHIAIGDNIVREAVSIDIKRRIPNIKFISIVHPNAIISDNIIVGDGCFIMAGSIINSSAKVSDFCIINTKSSLDHDCIMMPFSSLAPGVTVGGNTHIGARSAICIGSTLVHNIHIGIDCVIGAGSVVLKDIPDNTIAYGSPAKAITRRTKNYKYL